MGLLTIRHTLRHVSKQLQVTAIRSGILLMMQSPLSLYIIQKGGELEGSFGPNCGLGV
jgi:hypothetical protein